MSLPVIDTSKLFDVAGKTAIVIGATGSFGRVCTVSLADAGARLVLADLGADSLAELGDAIRSRGNEAVEIARLPQDEADSDAIVAAASDAYGAIDILVVASGINEVAPIVDMHPEQFDEVMLANAGGPWLIARAVGRQMIDQAKGGKIIFTSSARGKLGHPAGYSAYCTSKSAIDGLTKALGCEWGKYKISVNAIAPAVFRSPVTEWMFGETENAKKVREDYLSRMPVGRLGEPEDLAGPLLFLCSPASDFLTGHTIYADGGYTAG